MTHTPTAAATPATSPLPVRRSARLVLLNDADELLLMKIALTGRSFWCTIGGGIEDDETPEQAARREAFEEAGLAGADLRLGPVVWQGTHDLALDSVPTRHEECFFLARTGRRAGHLRTLLAGPPPATALTIALADPPDAAP